MDEIKRKKQLRPVDDAPPKTLTGARFLTRTKPTDDIKKRRKGVAGDEDEDEDVSVDDDFDSSTPIIRTTNVVKRREQEAKQRRRNRRIQMIMKRNNMSQDDAEAELERLEAEEAAAQEEKAAAQPAAQSTRPRGFGLIEMAQAARSDESDSDDEWGAGTNVETLIAKFKAATTNRAAAREFLECAARYNADLLGNVRPVGRLLTPVELCSVTRGFAPQF